MKKFKMSQDLFDRMAKRISYEIDKDILNNVMEMYRPQLTETDVAEILDRNPIAVITAFTTLKSMYNVKGYGLNLYELKYSVKILEYMRRDGGVTYNKRLDYLRKICMNHLKQLTVVANNGTDAIFNTTSRPSMTNYSEYLDKWRDADTVIITRPSMRDIKRYFAKQ